LLLAYGGLRQLPEARSGPAPHSSWAASTRATLAIRAMGDYARLMVWPANLHMERSVFGDERSPNAPELTTLAITGCVMLVLFAYGCWRDGRGRALRIFGAAWFLLAYLPISNLFELNATVAEHWLYLPSVGFLIFVMGCCLELPARARRIVFACACLAVVGLGARSLVRSGDWLSPEMFYRQALRTGAAKTRMALNLGQIYAARGDYAKAEPLLRKVVEMSPDYPMGLNALGHLLLSEGKLKEAEEVFSRATRLA